MTTVPSENERIWQKLDKQDEKLAVIPVMNEKLNNLSKQFEDFRHAMRWNVAQFVAILAVLASVAGIWISR